MDRAPCTVPNDVRSPRTPASTSPQRRRRPRHHHHHRGAHIVLGDRRPERDRLRRRHRQLGARPRHAEAAGPGAHLLRAGRRRLAPGLHPEQRAALQRALVGDPAVDEGRDRRDRGPALLPAQGRRLRRRRARRLQERQLGQDAAGRLDADDAAHPHAVSRPAGAHLQAQGPRGEARRGARERPRRPRRQGVDPREIHQLRALRDQRRPDGGRRAGRRAGVLQQARVPAHAAGVRAAGRPAAGAQPVQPVSQSLRGRRAPQRRPAQDGRGRLHHPRSSPSRRSARRSSCTQTATSSRSARATSSTTSPTS